MVESIDIRIVDNGYSVHVHPKQDIGAAHYDEGESYVYKTPEEVVECIEKNLPEISKGRMSSDMGYSDMKTVGKIIEVIGD